MDFPKYDWRHPIIAPDKNLAVALFVTVVLFGVKFRKKK